MGYVMIGLIAAAIGFVGAAFVSLPWWIYVAVALLVVVPVVRLLITHNLSYFEWAILAIAIGFLAGSLAGSLIHPLIYFK